MSKPPEKAPLRSPSALLKYSVKWSIQYVTCDYVAELFVDVVWPSIQDFWERVWKRKSAAEQISEIESIARSLPSDIDLQVESIIDEVLRETGSPLLSTEQRNAVRLHARHLPSTIRRHLKRIDDTTGTTITNALLPKTANELLNYVVPDSPRMSSGQPVPGSTYVLDTLLGTGGYGEVWKAIDRSARPNTVAIKFCFDPHAAMSLRRERDLLDKLQSIEPHPGIVRLTRVNLDCSTPWLQYDYVEGGTLANLIRDYSLYEHGPPNIEVILKLFLRIVSPVAYAHQNGVIHRDLKPSNILVCGSKESLRFMITDFGIGGIAAKKPPQSGKHTTSATFKHATQLGTFSLGYASKQQIDGAFPDARDDVFALGVILVQMLTGQLDRKEFTRKERENLPEDVINLVSLMTEVERCDRLASLDELVKQATGKEVIGYEASNAPEESTKVIRNALRILKTPSERFKDRVKLITKSISFQSTVAAERFRAGLSAGYIAGAIGSVPLTIVLFAAGNSSKTSSVNSSSTIITLAALAIWAILVLIASIVLMYLYDIYDLVEYRERLNKPIWNFISKIRDSGSAFFMILIMGVIIAPAFLLVLVIASLAGAVFGVGIGLILGMFVFFWLGGLMGSVIGLCASLLLQAIEVANRLYRNRNQ